MQNLYPLPWPPRPSKTLHPNPPQYLPPRASPHHLKSKNPRHLLLEAGDRFRRAEELRLQAAHLLVRAKEEAERGRRLQDQALQWQQDQELQRYRVQQAVLQAAAQRRAEAQRAEAHQQVIRAEVQRVAGEARQELAAHQAREDRVVVEEDRRAQEVAVEEAADRLGLRGQHRVRFLIRTGQ
jgi:hypothetical protein